MQCKTLASALLLFLFVALDFERVQLEAQAATSNCNVTGYPSGAYTVTLCITNPLDDAVLTSTVAVTASVTVTGTNPGVQRLLFYLGSDYLLTDYQAPYTFALPTHRFVDGARTLEGETVMRDGFITQRISLTVTFLNGVTTQPVNTKSFTPTKGTVPATGQPLVVAAAGDGAGGETNETNITDLIASWNPNLFLYLGDVYEQGTPTEFYNWYGTGAVFYNRFRAITNPAVGNHEYLMAGAVGYFDYWDNVPHYYSFDAGGWHFVSLDSAQVGQILPNTPQYQWLSQDLRTNPTLCILAYFHHPRWTIGPSDNVSYTLQLRHIWSLLAQHGVDIVLNGHDHNYQRWKPLDGAGNPSANGVAEFVVGTGGHATQGFIRADSRVAAGGVAYGALRLELHKGWAAYQFIDSTGITLDSGTLPCSPFTIMLPLIRK